MYTTDSEVPTMPEFDDVLQAPHYRPHLDYSALAAIDRYTILLKDGETTATIYPIHGGEGLPAGLLAFLCDEFNMEIERGDSVAFFDALHMEAFQNYWFGLFAGVMVLGDAPALHGPKQWEKECLGTFFIKPNYPGRASHVCTGGFLVNAGIRGKGIGRTLADCFLQWAPRLGYTYCVFNLVFETNVAARSIWESLNFKRIGRVKSAGILKGHDTAVDALMYGRELVSVSETLMGAYRFDKIKFYLETGKYPAMADRQEKSRLRSSASHYRLENGVLMLRDKEVVSDPVRQLQICTEIHMATHGGINKTTSAVTEKYHWTRIKDTVLAAVKNCAACRESAKEEVVMKLPAAPLLSKRLSFSTYPRHSLRESHLGPDLGPDLSVDHHSAKVAPHDTHEPSDHHHQQHHHHHPHHDGHHRTESGSESPAAASASDSFALSNRDDLLPHDLAAIDDGLIAVVEAAQKRHRSSDALLHHHHRPTYAAVAAAAVANHDPQFYHPDYSSHGYNGKYSTDHKLRDDHVPVDAEVAGFDHNVNAGGDEIEIARALMQSNDADDHEPSADTPDPKPESSDHDDTNLFFKND